MKVEGDYTFEAHRELVFETLQDPEVLAAVLPGCDKLELEDGVYHGRMNIKVGPVQGKFKGKVEMFDVNSPEGYSLKVEGKGVPGFVKADASITLAADGDAATTMSYKADARVGGRIASVGQRLIDTTARAIIKESLEGLHDIIKARAEHLAEHGDEDAEGDELEGDDVAEHEAVEDAPDAEPQSDEGEGEAAAEAEGAEPASAESTDADAAQPAPEPKAKKKRKKKRKPMPKPLPKRSESEMAARVAAEVSKELIPPPVRYAAMIAIAAAIIAAIYYATS